MSPEAQTDIRNAALSYAVHKFATADEIIDAANKFFGFLSGGEITVTVTPAKDSAPKPSKSAATDKTQSAAAPSADVSSSPSGAASAPAGSAPLPTSVAELRKKLTDVIVLLCKSPEKKEKVVSILGAYKTDKGETVTKGGQLQDGDVTAALGKLEAVK